MINSANCLAVARLVRMPCVAGFVEGIPSIVREDDSDLLYSVAEVLMAEKIETYFCNDDTAVSLGHNALNMSLKRHDLTIVVEQLIAAYGKLLTSCK